MSIELLAASIASRDCVFFAGSGLTRKSGGASWSDLVQYIIDKFNYSSPLSRDTPSAHFDIMQDIMRKNDPEEVYRAVSERLKDARIPDDFLGLIKLPWFAVFTTNYDLALERALRDMQNLRTRVIVTGNEFQLDGLLSELLCVKLMGSQDIPYRMPGSMVLDKGDLEIAMEERSPIFRTLAAHAANKTFLFFGYSFSDDLLFTILSKLSKYIGEPPNTYYALFRRRPTETIAYKLRQNNVEIIVSKPEDFVRRLFNEVSLRNPRDLTKKRIQNDDICRLALRSV